MKFLLDKQWWNACIKSRTCPYNPLSLTEEPICFFPVTSFAYLYSDRKPRTCQKLGNSPGVGKCPVPGQRKICKCPTFGTDKAGKCPAVAGGGGKGGRGGAGHSWIWLMHKTWPWNSNIQCRASEITEDWNHRAYWCRAIAKKQGQQQTNNRQRNKNDIQG